jgi:4,5-dihydroxyphthalate decarboxylase
MSHPTLQLKTLLGNYANTLAIKSGALSPKSFVLDFADVKVPNRAFKRAVRNLEFDVAELALVTFLQAKAYGKPMTLMPAVIGAGRFQHHCLVYNGQRPRVTVDQLRGKRIGIRAHAQTTVTWVRGVLVDDYGVDLRGIQWVTFEEGHLAEFPDPPGFERAPEGTSAVEMLLAGELDAAIIGTDLPDDPRLQSVLPDPHKAALAWSARHQMRPINHMVALDVDLCRQHPEVVRELYAMLLQSKHMAPTKADQTIDLTPFGIEPNRRSLALLIRYAYQQGLIPRAYAVDELFEEFTQAMGTSAL